MEIRPELKIVQNRKTYRGRRLGPKDECGDVEVRVNYLDENENILKDEVLRHYVYHSPTGFEWGYGGSGPCDLSRAILLDYFDEVPKHNPKTNTYPPHPSWHSDEELQADKWYQSFVSWFVCEWGSEWSVTSREIEKWLKDMKERLAKSDNAV